MTSNRTGPAQRASETDLEAIGRAVKRLLEEYRRRPLYYLREAGLQGRLQSLLHDKLRSSRSHEAHASVVEKGNRRKPLFKREGVHELTARVQPEARIQTGASLGRRQQEKSDVVMLRQAPKDDPIELTNYPNGPLDIVRLIEASDAVAVIELKATVSAAPHMRHLFREDVCKLLALKSHPSAHHLSMHFVLIDKSLPIGRHVHASERGMPKQWWREDLDDCKSRSAARALWERSNAAFAVTAGSGDDGAGVHIWQLAPDDSGKLVVHRSFARKTSGKKINPGSAA